MNENNNTMNFDDARVGAENAFNEAAAQENQNMLADRLEEQQEQQEEQNVKVNEAVNSAAQAVGDAENAMQNQQAELEGIMSENQQLKQAINEMRMQNQQIAEQINEYKKREEQQSELQKKAIMEQSLEMPHLNVSELAFADEETVQRMQDDYARKMAEFTRNQVMDELSPFIREAEAAREAKERARIIDALAADDAFSGIRDSEKDINKLLDENASKFSPDLDLEEKIAMAYIMQQGAKSLTAPPPAQPKSPNLDELMKMYDENPEFRAAVEEKRINSLKKGQQVPPMSASQGAANAALYIKEKPKSFDAAFENAKKLFGSN